MTDPTPDHARNHAQAEGHVTHSERPVAVWLFLCCAMVLVMVVLGGMTRLIHAGLSIVEWQPLIGALPPLSAADWTELFDKYRQFPEYRKLNQGMSLDEFKNIFWMEWTHRQWGRLVGVVFAVPFLWWLVKGRLHIRLSVQLWCVLALGAAQAALGWYMVRSGLVDEPDVSPYRLAAHLGLAMAILAWMLRLALDLWRPKADAADWPAGARGASRFAAILAGLVFFQALSGAFVAGLDAGLVYNTFPLMNGTLIPAGYLDLDPWWRNLFENIDAVQFDHRWIGVGVLVFTWIFWWHARRLTLPGGTRAIVHAVMVAALAQVALGIATLIYVVPVPLAATHQAGAMVLFTLALWAAHSLRAAVGGNRATISPNDQPATEPTHDQG